MGLDGYGEGELKHPLDTPSETAPHYTEILELVTWGNTVKGKRRQICDENCPTEIGDVCENNKRGVMFWHLRIATFEQVGHPFHNRSFTYNGCIQLRQSVDECASLRWRNLDETDQKK